MPRVLVVHGAGMNMRGKVQVDIFGPMTLPEYDERIRGYAKELGVEVEIFHSNVEGEIVNRLYAANDEGFDAAIFNPAAFGTGYPALVAAISQVKFPTVEVHISNPIRHADLGLAERRVWKEERALWIDIKEEEVPTTDRTVERQVLAEIAKNL
jgi:3-dehydroquinate dehydratase-2